MRDHYLYCHICQSPTNECACGHRIPGPLLEAAATSSLAPAFGGASISDALPSFFVRNIEGACTSRKRGNARDFAKFQGAA